MADYKLLLGILLGFAILSILDLALPGVQSAQPPTPPPTPAYSTIHIVNNATWPNSTISNITAIIYNDEWILGADDSILINITNLTP